MELTSWQRVQAFFYHPTEQRHIVRLLFMPVICASPSLVTCPSPIMHMVRSD